MIKMPQTETFVATIQVLRRIAIPIELYELLSLREGEKIRVSIEKVSA
jgi:bifunctional DNA-binding transcriptional regulator/antitoxin component of YhaV-PrlF toxin-antitoxin module